MKRVLEGII